MKRRRGYDSSWGCGPERAVAGWLDLSSERNATRTDLTDEEWRFIQPFLPPVPKRGRKPTTDLRAVLDAPTLSCPDGRRLADAAERLPTVADGLLVVQAVRSPAAVPHDPRCRADARSRAREPGAFAKRGGGRQSVHQGAGGEQARGSMPERRWSAASCTSRSTPTAGC